MASIAMEVSCQWAQRLPLRENMLICIHCEQVKPIHDIGEPPMQCAELNAWQHYGRKCRPNTNRDRGWHLIIPITEKA